MRRVKLFEDFEDDEPKTELYSFIVTDKIRQDFIASIYEYLTYEEDDDENLDYDLDIWGIMGDYVTDIKRNISSYLEENKDNLVLELIERHPELVTTHYEWLDDTIDLPDWAKRSKKTGLLDAKIKEKE